MTTPTPTSIVVVTFNRREILRTLLDELTNVIGHVLEVIVIDNCSSDGTDDMIRGDYPFILYHRTEENRGVGARNEGIALARGEFVITIDDNILGIDTTAIEHVCDSFRNDPSLGALNFHVVDHFTNRTCNWVHHRAIADATSCFDTYEITEGAVAFRLSALRVTGGYYEEYFISHEGPDLAFRLMNAGYRVAYDGSIAVRHKRASQSREPWRFYYYNTRNQIWLATRNMPALYAARYLAIGLGSMSIYALRDGHMTWWLRGVMDGLLRLGRIRHTRCPWTPRTAAAVRLMNKHRPGFWTLVRQRLFSAPGRLDS